MWFMFKNKKLENHQGGNLFECQWSVMNSNLARIIPHPPCAQHKDYNDISFYRSFSTDKGFYIYIFLPSAYILLNRITYR